MDAHLVSLVAPGSLEAERYRGLRLVVERMRKAGEGTVVGVCSPTAGDGKSITAVNLAGSLAQDLEARVLLIEIDLHRPSMDGYLALRDPAGLGLADFILDASLALEGVVRRLPSFNLSVLPAGSLPAAPYEVLKSQRLGDLLTEARRRYDYVILDCPPVVPVADCRLIEEWVDGFLMVVAAHQTARRMLEEALNLMRPEKVLGIVFNRHDRPASRKYEYYQYAYKGAESRSRRSRSRRGSRTSLSQHDLPQGPQTRSARCAQHNQRQGRDLRIHREKGRFEIRPLRDPRKGV